jgi:transcriptional regulator with XRE-family HTH domain
MAEYQERVGRRIRAERERHGWSQNELASRIPGKTDGAAVGRWERGGVMPRPDTLDAIAAALEVDPAALLAPEPPDDAGTSDLMGSLSSQAAGDLAARLDQVTTAVEKLLEAQEVLAQMATADRELLREVAQAVRPKRKAH